jgi:DNA polymerase III subunit delta'
MPREAAPATPPRASPLLLGHEEAERRVEQWIAQDRLPQALLICGPWGIGKATLAFRIARRLLRRAPRGRPPLTLPPRQLSSSVEDPPEMEALDETVRWIASGTHPDLLTVERGFDEKRGRALSEIVIGDVRRIGVFLTSSPAMGGWRVVVVDAADDMNRNAANALLKILEEPTAKSLLILVAHQPGLVVATVRSRCRKLILRPLSDRVLGDLMAQFVPDLPLEDAAFLRELADGSIGRVLQLAKHDGLTVCRSLRAFFHALSNNDRKTLMASVANSGLGADEEGFRVASHILLWWVRRIARASLSRFPPGSPQAGEQDGAIGRAAAAAALDHWLKVWDKTHHLAVQADAGNLDRKQVLTTILLDLQRAPQVARS